MLNSALKLFPTGFLISFRRDIKSIVEGEPQQLIETVAEALAYTILRQHSLVQTAVVRVDKPQAPIKGPFRTIGTSSSKLFTIVKIVRNCMKWLLMSPDASGAIHLQSTDIFAADPPRQFCNLRWSCTFNK